jgi:hypothetical protein
MLNDEFESGLIAPKGLRRGVTGEISLATSGSVVSVSGTTDQISFLLR